MTRKPTFRFLAATAVMLIAGMLVAAAIAVKIVLPARAIERAKTDVVRLAVAVKAYQTEYGKLPTKHVSADDAEEGMDSGGGWFMDDNREVVRVLAGENVGGLNPKKIVFLETRPAAGNATSPRDGVAADGTFYDPWGTPYGVKMDTSYNNALEYYGVNQANNFRTTVIAVSYGENGIQQDPGRSTDKGKPVDDVVSFR
jgi:type II secretory pathway pseudopilin PulG